MLENFMKEEEMKDFMLLFRFREEFDPTKASPEEFQAEAKNSRRGRRSS